MSIKDIRSKTQLNQREFAEHYHIPLQTLKQWESAPRSTSYRKPPDYVLYLLGTMVLAEYAVDQDVSKDDPIIESGLSERLKKYSHLIRAAQDSRGDARLWCRYLRKEFEGDSCRIDGEGLAALMNSDELSMFQKISLKRAAQEGSPTNSYITGLNKRASTPTIDAIRRKANAFK